jgi:hypothetical protein
MPLAAVLPVSRSLRKVHGRLERLAGLNAELAKKGLFYDCNRYFGLCVDRVVHNSAALVGAQAETTDDRVSNTKNVSILRIDHISTQSALPGVWRGQRLKAVIT